VTFIFFCPAVARGIYSLAAFDLRQKNEPKEKGTSDTAHDPDGTIGISLRSANRRTGSPRALVLKQELQEPYGA